MSYHEWLWLSDRFRVNETIPVRDRREYSLRPNYKNGSGARINKSGFRGVEVDVDAAAKLIVNLGDSVPFGKGVVDEETYPSYLQHHLKQDGYTNINVLNAGVPSYNYRQSFDRLRIDVLTKYRPTIITLEAANDLSLLSHFHERWSPDRTWAEIRWGHPSDKFRKTAMFYYLSRAIESDYLEEKLEIVPLDRMLESLNDVFSEGLAICRDHNIVVILLPINPFYYSDENDERNRSLRLIKRYSKRKRIWDRMLTKINQHLYQLSQQYDNVYYFDSREMMDLEDRSELYIDYIHYSPKGNQILAQGLLEYMVRHGLLGNKE